MIMERDSMSDQTAPSIPSNKRKKNKLLTEADVCQMDKLEKFQQKKKKLKTKHEPEHFSCTKKIGKQDANGIINETDKPVNMGSQYSKFKLTKACSLTHEASNLDTKSCVNSISSNKISDTSNQLCKVKSKKKKKRHTVNGSDISTMGCYDGNIIHVSLNPCVCFFSSVSGY